MGRNGSPSLYPSKIWSGLEKSGNKMNDEDGERLTDPRIFVGFQKRGGKLMSVTRDGGNIRF